MVFNINLMESDLLHNDGVIKRSGDRKSLS